MKGKEILKCIAWNGTCTKHTQEIIEQLYDWAEQGGWINSLLHCQNELIFKNCAARGNIILMVLKKNLIHIFFYRKTSMNGHLKKTAQK